MIELTESELVILCVAGTYVSYENFDDDGNNLGDVDGCLENGDPAYYSHLETFKEGEKLIILGNIRWKFYITKTGFHERINNELA